MIKKMGIRWNLRRLMAARDMFQTTDLVAPLAERGVHLSRERRQQADSVGQDPVGVDDAHLNLPRPAL